MFMMALFTTLPLSCAKIRDENCNLSEFHTNDIELPPGVPSFYERDGYLFTRCEFIDKENSKLGVSCSAER